MQAFHVDHDLTNGFLLIFGAVGVAVTCQVARAFAGDAVTAQLRAGGVEAFVFVVGWRLVGREGV